MLSAPSYPMLMERRTYAPNRVREVRTARKISQEALGLAMEPQLTGSTIAKLENGRQALSLDYVLEMARVLQCDPADLIVARGALARMVPLIGRVEAGNWREAVEMSLDTVPVPDHVRGSNLFALKATGDSMDRICPDGGTIIVDPDDRELRDKKFYVIMNGGAEATFKQFCASPMQLLPCSNNPEHKPIPLGSEPFTVIGRVVFAGADL